VVGTSGAGGAALRLLGVAAAIAVVAGSAMALAQRDLGRMLAYSSVGQMGYVIMGFAIGNAAGVTGALLHILNHAVMKGCLFMSGGAVAWRTGVTSVRGYTGMARRLPLTMAGFSLAALSMIGLPPTCGFFSKWYLVLGALQRGAWPYVVALVASSLMTAVYFLRILERAYFGEGDARREPGRGPLELPLSMLAPALLLAFGTLALGVFNQGVVVGLIRRALPGGL
jgi:multicomponent Na+:H+ antiporter subunit D